MLGVRWAGPPGPWQEKHWSEVRKISFPSASVAAWSQLCAGRRLTQTSSYLSPASCG